MDSIPGKTSPRRRHTRDRVILHIDLDCFYAQCVENRQPSLRALPLGIKQKGILATCNYVARRHGVKKLMPIAEARRLCPDLVLADGEDLSPFRDVSKRLYALLRACSWNGRIERLGLDEIFLDVTDIVSYNVELLNRNALRQSFFCLSRSDPEVGFEFDATSFAGCVYGDDESQAADDVLRMRLLLGSHLAQHLRLKVEAEGYTSSCGIATNKLLAKLAGDKNKPRNQTTLIALSPGDTLAFMDEHNLRKVPGIGSKIARVLEGFLLGKEPDRDAYSMECSVTVGQVRLHPATSAPALERLLAGPGAEKGIGNKVWSLLHGIDDADVKPARDVPTQISIEDSYRGLDTIADIRRALVAITVSLLRRMHTDLLEDDPPAPRTATSTTAQPTPNPSRATPKKRWLACPKTIRLSTRPYINPAENQPYSFARASRSAPLPSFVLSNSSTTTSSDPSKPDPSLQETAERLVAETLLPLFHRLNPVPSQGPGPGPGPLGNGSLAGGGPQGEVGYSNSDSHSYNIGLMNVCVTNMSSGAAAAAAADIGDMFRRQREDGVVGFGAVGVRSGLGCDYGRDDDMGGRQGEYRVGGSGGGGVTGNGAGVGDKPTREGDATESKPRAQQLDGEWDLMDDHQKEEEQSEIGDGESGASWDNDETPEDDMALCPLCDRLMPLFAMSAHERYHSLEGL